MATYGNVNINFTLSDIKEFSYSVDKTLNAMTDVYNSMLSAYNRAKEYLEKNIANADECIRACDNERKAAVEEIPNMREAKRNLEERRKQLNSYMEKLRPQISKLYDAYRKYCAEQTRINNRKPTKSGSGEAADAAYKAAVKSWQEAKKSIQEDVDSSYSDYIQAKRNLDEAQQKSQNCENAIGTVENCIYKLEDTVRKLEQEYIELENSKREFESALSELERAWNNFSGGYDGVENALNRVKNSVRRAYDAAYTVAEDIALLKGSGVKPDEAVAFRSIEAVADCAEEIKLSADKIMRQYSGGLSFNSYYADRINDPVMREIIKANEDIGQSFRITGEKYGQVAERLDMLADSLKEYIKCEL